MERGPSAIGYQKASSISHGCTSSEPRPVKASGGLAATLNGEANAIGENTLSDAQLYCRTIDRGAVQVAFGSATLTAIAQSPSEEIAYAAADSFVDIAGADFSFSSTVNWSGGTECKDKAWSAEISQTSFVAFNIVGWNLPLGSFDVHTEVKTNKLSIPTIQGNVASYEINTVAEGDDSYVNADNVSLATDGISTNSSSATSGVGSTETGAAPILRGRANDMIITTHKDTYIDAGDGRDCIMAGNGDDWIFAGSGKDIVYTGSGDNTVFAGDGDDVVTAQNGDDWIFGGDGKDVINAGSGHNIIDGGAGSDSIFSGSGNDVIRGGMGNDCIHAGGGRNNIQLGMGSRFNDGNDTVTTGNGDDLFFLFGNFGRDTINGFVVGQGDRLVVCEGFWNFDMATPLLGSAVSLARSKTDPRDLNITFCNEDGSSILTLDNFFQLNPSYGSPQSRAALTNAQISAIRHDIFIDGTDEPAVATRAEYFAIGDYLGLLS